MKTSLQIFSVVQDVHLDHHKTLLVVLLLLLFFWLCECVWGVWGGGGGGGGVGTGGVISYHSRPCYIPVALFISTNATVYNLTDRIINQIS